MFIWILSGLMNYLYLLLSRKEDYMIYFIRNYITEFIIISLIALVILVLAVITSAPLHFPVAIFIVIPVAISLFFTSETENEKEE